MCTACVDVVLCQGVALASDILASSLENIRVAERSGDVLWQSEQAYILISLLADIWSSSFTRAALLDDCQSTRYGLPLSTLGSGSTSIQANMASTFSPIQLSDDPRSWKAEIGLLNPETHAVAFNNLNDLVRWLKTLSVDVDSNLTRQFPSFGQPLASFVGPLGVMLRCVVVARIEGTSEVRPAGQDDCRYYTYYSFGAIRTYGTSLHSYQIPC